MGHEERGERPAAAARRAAIWAAVAAIPRGAVATYGGIAARAGYPRAARLVGRALKEAPAGRRLPWHRVLRAGGRIAFPVGTRAYREQRRRLVAEGHVVEGARVVPRRAAGLDALLWGGPR
jgi:methylated-DNA-protein-cysteine methyltransferase-like protein